LLKKQHLPDLSCTILASMDLCWLTDEIMVISIEVDLLVIAIFPLLYQWCAKLIFQAMDVLLMPLIAIFVYFVACVCVRGENVSSDIQPIVHVLILERWGIFVCVCVRVRVCACCLCSLSCYSAIEIVIRVMAIF